MTFLTTDNYSPSNLPTTAVDAGNDNQTLPTAKYFLDKYTDIAINSSFFIAAILCLIFSAMSFVAMNRTRNIPRTACFLSSSLLLFDCATTLTYATRKFIDNSDILNIITLIGLGWSYASFINVAIMAVERLIVVQWPYFYTRKMSYYTSIKILITLMVLYLVAWTSEWIACFFKTSGFWNIRACWGPIIIKYMTVTFATLLVVIVICFMKIVMIIIVKQRSKVHPERQMSSRNNRSIIVVFLCCVNYVFTALINLILVYTTDHVSIVVRRTILDILYMLNGLVDTFVYVLWYKECRYQLLKMIAVVIPSLRPKIERMRVQIFEIMTSDGTNVN